MKLFTYKTKDGIIRLGTFWDEKSVIDIIKLDELLLNSKFEHVKNMEDFIALNSKGIKRLYQLLAELKILETKDNDLFNEIKLNTFFLFKNIKLLPPISNPQKIICLGCNFSDHAKEAHLVVPKNPMIWGKFNSAIIGHHDSIVLPRISNKIDVEAELVVIIGKEGKYIPEENALDFVYGYSIGNDVSARDLQHEDKQFTRSKTIDTFAPIGPWIVTKDEIPDPQTLNIELAVNERVWQKGNTKDMIFSVAYTISYLSNSFTFKSGDLIFMGTPAGVGCYQNPPAYLKKDDIVQIKIEKIGELENKVISESI